jgi:hypothetical protein
VTSRTEGRLNLAQVLQNFVTRNQSISLGPSDSLPRLEDIVIDVGVNETSRCAEDEPLAGVAEAQGVIGRLCATQGTTARV